MLRRVPTAIAVTTEDVIAFEEATERRQAELAAKRQQQQEEENRNSIKEAHKSAKQPGKQSKLHSASNAQDARTRDERIGYSRHG
ncbi:hypothetical protein KEM56_006452 [Ascosphaera pollenicola]|nr:hypothetical protein KEM56_006452 [Ascosphaera pollenicola]